MSKARGLADLGNVYSDGALSNRNMIINGGMTVSQRGDYTTATAFANNTYYLDRWLASRNAVTATLQDIGNKVKLVATSTATGSMRVIQKVELSTMNKFNGVQVTCSALVKSNSADTRILFYGDGYLSDSVAHTGDGTEQLLTVTTTVPAATMTVEFDVFVGIHAAGGGDLAIANGDYIEVKDVQLELGDQATPFEHRSYGDELARCQRYYQVAEEFGAAINIYGVANVGYLYVNFKATMRVSPSMTFPLGTANYGIHWEGSNNGAGTFQINAGSRPDGASCSYAGGGGLPDAVQTAHAYFKYTADAEL